MAIDALNNNFGYLTYRPQQANGNRPYGSYQGVPNTTPEVVSFGMPSIDQMEKANAFLNGNLNTNSINPYRSQVDTNVKAGWEGFKLPENNGTGELKPVMGGGDCANIIDFCA